MATTAVSVGGVVGSVAGVAAGSVGAARRSPVVGGCGRVAGRGRGDRQRRDGELGLGFTGWGRFDPAHDLAVVVGLDRRERQELDGRERPDGDRQRDGLLADEPADRSRPTGWCRRCRRRRWSLACGRGDRPTLDLGGNHVGQVGLLGHLDLDRHRRRVGRARSGPRTRAVRVDRRGNGVNRRLRYSRRPRLEIAGDRVAHRDHGVAREACGAWSAGSCACTESLATPRSSRRPREAERTSSSSTPHAGHRWGDGDRR